MEKIKIGLLGVGTHTEENIIPSIKLNKISKITSVYSSNLEKLNKLSFDYDIENLYLNTQELIDSSIDCVFIAGSPTFHEDLVFKCIEKNIPFFVEKPPLRSIESFTRLQNVKLPTNFVGYNFRYFDQYIKTPITKLLKT